MALVPALSGRLLAAPGPAASAPKPAASALSPAAAASAALAAGRAAAGGSASALGSALAAPAVPMGHGSAAPLASGAPGRPAGSAGAAPPPAQAGDPHAGMNLEGAGRAAQMPRVLESRLKPEPTLPPQTVVVEVIDGATERPMPGVEVTLNITERSVAKGDAKSQRTLRSDGAGVVTFDKLDFPQATEFRASVLREGATFASPPFQLVQVKAMRATLYVFPVARSIREAAIIVRGFAFAEILDDAIQISQAYRILNLGSNAWQADGVKVQLPPGAKAFKGEVGDLVWTSGEDSAVLRGTITPGQHDASFRFQIPWNGERDVAFELGILPQVQSFRLASDSPQGLQLQGEGFTEAEPMLNNAGQRMLVVEKALQKPDPTFRSVKARLINMPVRPVGRWYAVAIAAVAIAGGLYGAGRLRAVRPRGGGLTEDERLELEEAKTRLLDELAALDKAHTSGEVGPKTYERLRRNLTDALARLLARLEGSETEGAAPYRARAERGAGRKQPEPEAEPVDLGRSSPRAEPEAEPGDLKRASPRAEAEPGDSRGPRLGPGPRLGRRGPNSARRGRSLGGATAGRTRAMSWG
ncbi:MAG TPA: hypothetical protein VFS43_28555 [Polyangiaceae bacterium]|nr:hypothetical protein [Polyangiaceae bacterium]